MFLRNKLQETFFILIVKCKKITYTLRMFIYCIYLKKGRKLMKMIVLTCMIIISVSVIDIYKDIFDM